MSFHETLSGMHTYVNMIILASYLLGVTYMERDDMFYVHVYGCMFHVYRCYEELNAIYLLMF